MSYNIIDEYINFIRKKYVEFFKIIFEDRHNKDICLAFVNKYIEVRYYNETNYPKDKDFTNRINRELIDLFEELVDEDNIEYLKNMVALFGYIIYFDDVSYVTQEVELIDSIISDNIIKIQIPDESREKLKEWCIELKKGKENFEDAVYTKDFSLMENRLYRKLHYLTLEHDVKISNLYSEYAIDRAYTTGTVNEDKLFVMYVLASYTVLNNALNLDFSKYYMVPFASSLFEKEKKCARLFGVLNNPLAKKYISIRITYTDYIKNKKLIDEYINDGYIFGLEIDAKYTGNLTELFVFPYVLVYADSPEYEMIDRDKEQLKAKVIKL